MKRETKILLFLTIIVFTFLPSAPYLRDFLKNFLGDKVYKIFWISSGIIFFILIFYFSIKNKKRFIFFIFLIPLFLIKGAPEEKFHIFLYFLIGYFSRKNFKNYGILYFTGLAIIDEIIQYFLPNRYFDLKDIIINLGAGIIGFLF